MSHCWYRPMMLRSVAPATCCAVWLMACPVTPAAAQVVQLPTYRVFSYSGSVSVPDRGTAVIGGRSGYSSSSRGRGGGRSDGRGVSSGGLSVSATIIDLDAIDRQILDQGEARPTVAAGHAADEEGKRLVRYARKMHAQGRDAVATLSYQMAIRKLSEPLARLAREELRARYPAATATATATPAP